MKTVYSTFRKLHEDGITGPGTQEEQGPTWTQFFPQGIIGIMPMPATLSGYPEGGIANEDIGVTPIAGITGGQSTFVGGDSIGISRDSQGVPDAGLELPGPGCWMTRRRSRSSPRTATS